jgi:hypothetical protein
MDDLLKNVHEAANNRPLTHEELLTAYLAGFVHTCFNEDFNNPSTWKADPELISHVAIKLSEATVRIFQEIQDKQEEEMRELLKELPLNG